MAFTYYGSKVKVIDLYPPPDHQTIIEPFAGSARYALKYFTHQVIINDLYDAVYESWKWIVSATAKDIRALPEIPVGGDLRDYKQLSFGERCVLGFVINPGSASPRNIVTTRAGEQEKRRSNITRFKAHLLRMVGKLSHWKVTNLSYEKLPDLKATYFIDPPYINQGQHYVHDSSGIDFAQLGSWCLSRKGQVIVCEGKGATWLPFKSLLTIRKDCQRPNSTKEKGEVFYDELIYHRQSKKVGFGLNT